MKCRVILAGLLATAIAAPMQAQCPTAAADGCRKAADLLNFMTPQLSTALVGGNPTLGQGGVLGGLGRFSIDIRASAVNGQLPKFNNVGLSITGEKSSTFTSDKQYIPFPSVDLGVGVWRGFSLGVTHVGGVDAILTATYLPTNVGGDNSGTDKTSFKVGGSNPHFGYGVRVGLLEESAVTPGVSFVWAQRDLPTLSLSSTVDASGANPGGTLSLNNYSVNTSVWRITAAKSFLIFGISAGLGQDKYTSNSSVTATVNTAGNPTGTKVVDFSMTRMNYFAGFYMNLFVFKLEVEAGQVTGGTVPVAINSFGADPATSRGYITAGLRFGWGR